MEPNRSGPDAPAASELAARTNRAASAHAPDEARIARNLDGADRPALAEANPGAHPAADASPHEPGTPGTGAPRMIEAARPANPGRANDSTSAPEQARLAEPQRQGPDAPAGQEMSSCTAPQLRRFIKSRPYVPMHELRRRFGINGSEDDVSSIDLGNHHHVYVGLPSREGSLLGELFRGGDIGYELSMDPRTPVVIGLYPMRPVARS